MELTPDRRCAVATRVLTVNDILDGHGGLDLECFDRIYLNGWVPTLQVPGQAAVPKAGRRVRRRQ